MGMGADDGAELSRIYQELKSLTDEGHSRDQSLVNLTETLKNLDKRISDVEARNEDLRGM